ncbi:MAG: hypothetical protein MJE68_27485, partial [Proteobacteria bacterium]|nr:hypothetical protein [Pseudomonadota bacterium]
HIQFYFFLVVEFVKYRVTHLNVCFEDVLFGAHAQLTIIVSLISRSTKQCGKRVSGATSQEPLENLS